MNRKNCLSLSRPAGRSYTVKITRRWLLTRPRGHTARRRSELGSAASSSDQRQQVIANTRKKQASPSPLKIRHEKAGLKLWHVQSLNRSLSGER